MARRQAKIERYATYIKSDKFLDLKHFPWYEVVLIFIIEVIAVYCFLLIMK